LKGIYVNDKNNVKYSTRKKIKYVLAFLLFEHDPSDFLYSPYQVWGVEKIHVKHMFNQRREK
tara:strand:- start:2379 stop:2564 length:186 start_codon:yes stop_codon:yes gene_type:complete